MYNNLVLLKMIEVLMLLMSLSYFAEQMMKHRETIDSKEREIMLLQEKLRARDAELSRVREDEMQRAQILQSAVMNYVSKVPSSPR
jgi:Tfp pilus assembly protein PilN